MADLVIDKIIDLILSTVEAVIPRTVPDIRFKRHRAPAPLRDANGAVRYFQVDIPTLLDTDQWPARSDGVSAWYATDQLLLKIWYPDQWVINGDTTERGISIVKIEDTIDLNTVLVYNDFLADVSIASDSYVSPQFKGTYQEGSLYVLKYTFSWQEVF